MIDVKKVYILLSILLFILCTSCTQSIENIGDEIRLNKWCLTTAYGKEVSLKFIDDIAVFRINSKDKRASTKIKGVCTIDKKAIVIFDGSDNENYIFKYKLKDNKLKLTFDGGTIALLKK